MPWRAPARMTDPAEPAGLSRRTTIATVGLVGVVCVLLSSACGSGVFRQYEYEEDTYLALDGTATVYVNSSIAALNALRGTTFDANPASRVNTDAVRAFFTTADTQVTRISPFRRNGRRFVSVRMDVADIRRLGETAPFAWSTYRFGLADNQYTFVQTVGAAAGAAANPGWNGRELVAFRLHLPSKIRYHNTRGVESRGNILAWEQPLAARLRGEPLTIEARMDTRSILYTTLWLFGITFVAVAAAFAAVIWWVMRRGAETPVAPAR